MDTGEGRFVRVGLNRNMDKEKLEELMNDLQNKYPNHGSWFSQGQILNLDGITFKIKKIKPGELILKFLARTPSNMKVFEVGEKATIGESTFKVKSMNKHGMRLKLIKRRSDEKDND